MSARRLAPPRVYCPFPAALHPDAARLETGTLAWLRQFGFITSLEEEAEARRMQFSALAAFTYPYGALDRVQLVSDFMTYVFVADDRWAERAVIGGQPVIFAQNALASLRVMQAPDASASEPEPAMRALADLMHRLQAIATDEQRHRIVVGVVEYLMATGCEILFRITGTRPSLADYRRLRESVMMMRSFCFAFIELVDQFELSDRLWMRPDVQQTARLASQAIGVTHDVFSSARERSWPGAVNLPLLLMQEHGCSWTAAIEMALAEVRRLTDAFLQSAAPLRTDPLLARYVVGLERWMRGHVEWSMITGRYRPDAPLHNDHMPSLFGE